MNKASPVPLPLQIQSAELRVQIRKQLVACRAAQISVQFRNKMTSPWTFLAAIAAGFLLQRLLRPLFAGRSGFAAASGAKTASRLGLFAGLAQILAVVRALLTAWPAALVRRVGVSRQSRPSASRQPDNSGYPPHQSYP